MKLDQVEVRVAEEGIEHANGGKLVPHFFTLVLSHFFSDCGQEFAELWCLICFVRAERDLGDLLAEKVQEEAVLEELVLVEVVGRWVRLLFIMLADRHAFHLIVEVLTDLGVLEDCVSWGVWLDCWLLNGGCRHDPDFLPTNEGNLPVWTEGRPRDARDKASLGKAFRDSESFQELHRFFVAWLLAGHRINFGESKLFFTDFVFDLGSPVPFA